MASPQVAPLFKSFNFRVFHYKRKTQRKFDKLPKLGVKIWLQGEKEQKFQQVVSIGVFSFCSLCFFSFSSILHQLHFLKTFSLHFCFCFGGFQFQFFLSFAMCVGKNTSVSIW